MGKLVELNEIQHLKLSGTTIKGTLLSTSAAGTSNSLSTGGWLARTTVTVATAPANAQFAVPVIEIAGTAVGETFYFDAAQFRKSSICYNV